MALTDPLTGKHFQQIPHRSASVSSPVTCITKALLANLPQTIRLWLRASGQTEGDFVPSLAPMVAPLLLRERETIMWILPRSRFGESATTCEHLGCLSMSYVGIVTSWVEEKFAHWIAWNVRIKASDEKTNSELCIPSYFVMISFPTRVRICLLWRKQRLYGVPRATCLTGVSAIINRGGHSTQ